MSLRIETKDIFPYRPGTPVSGLVLFTGKHDIGIQEISIVLSGHSKSEIIRREGARGPLGIASSQTYREKVTLFAEKHILFQGPSNLPLNHSWPFTFTFPGNCGAATPQIRTPETYRFVNDQDNNPLPPSFESFNLPQRSSCYIRYKLRASVQLSKRNAFSSKAYEVTKQLDFLPHLNISDVNFEIFSEIRPVSSISLQSKCECEGHLSFLKKLMPSRTEVSSVAFNIDVTMPKAAVTGKSLPITLIGHYEIEAFPYQTSPPILLTKFTVILCAETLIRGLQPEPQMKNAEKTWSSKHVVVEHDFSKCPRPIADLEEPLDMRKLVNLRLDRTYAIPGFVTFNIARSYSLEIMLEVGCGRKKFSLKFPSGSKPDLFVLPLSNDPCRDVAREGLRSCRGLSATAESADAFNELSQETPPAYLCEALPPYRTRF